jgi:hypothetical protein
MTESVREIRFEHFRGLPAYSCELKGKNLVVLGGNGKGKSAIVDGLEFLFAGHIGRFRGEGTGAIDAGDAIRHVLKKGEPVVELWFTPTNACVRRRLSGTNAEVPARPTIQAYIESHPPAGAFILRRAQILDFISDQDATRYQKYIHLLGLSEIDSMQKAFVDAEERAAADHDQQRRTVDLQLAGFRDVVSAWAPTSFSSIMTRCFEAVRLLGIGTFNDWGGLDAVTELLEAKRSPATKALVDALNRAIASLQRPLPTKMGLLTDTVNDLHAELRGLRSTSNEAAQSGVIREAITFLENHPDATVCPLCEQDFEDGYSATFEKLRRRSVALVRMQEAETRRRNLLEQLVTDAQRAADQLASDLEHADLVSRDEVRALRDARATALRWVRLLRSTTRQGRLERLDMPKGLDAAVNLRSSLAAGAEITRTSLIPADEAQLENAIALLRKSKGAEPAIRQAEAAIRKTRVLVSDARDARMAFSQAREEAIQKAFDRIAGRVLQFYKKLHDHGSQPESAECSDLALTQTARAAAGGLRLAIDFLGLTGFRDPRPFLSEGHLDSLGLCLYLATVRIFNEPGSLLVLDDVLTSIDKGHRYRVAELLFEQFGDYQLLLTTHDEHWSQILQSSAQARGDQGKWRFSRIARWTVESGPESAAFEGTWDYIGANLTEESYRELGGPLRVVLEDFLKRVAAKIELEVRFNLDAKYTSGDFVHAGIHNEIRNRLLTATPAEEAGIKQDVTRVFGMGDLINFLSHDNPQRLEVTFEQASDFVSGLKSLTARCQAGKLIKGVTAS